MIDLMIPFSEDRKLPYYEQIYRYIRDEIQEGRIAFGERLPSTRTLAEKLGVSRSTTQLAYDQLTAEGYLENRPRSGYYAARVDRLPGFSAGNPADAVGGARWEKGTSDFPADGASRLSGPGTERTGERRGDGRDEGRQAIDFSPRGIDLEHFPYSQWRKLSREILQEENKSLFDSGPNRGEESLRKAVCAYLGGARGILCRPEQIVIGAGAEYLLMLLTQLLGIRRVAMENPTYLSSGRTLQSLGHEVIPVSMDQSGMYAGELASSGADLAYIMPSHQFPTGAVMTISRRQEILRWAGEEEERYVIEDDYDSEFRYRGKPIPAMAGADSSGKVIYLGTFSKSVAPAIRVSFLVLPEALNRRYEETCGFYSSTVSRVDQEILARFMSGGYFERHLNRMRGIYRAKHDALLAALEPLEDHFRIRGERAGLHVLMESADGIPESELIRRAAGAGVRVYPLSEYFLRPAESRTVLLGYAKLSEEEIREGAGRLVRAWTASAAASRP